MSKYLRVKNWENFQHYKERNPPWIKLHRELLRDYDFVCLQDASKLHLMLIWLLASQMNNKIPADENFIKNQIGISGKIDFKELIDKGFLIDDSNALATRKQDAMLETETETETDKRQNRAPRFNALSWLKENGVSDKVAQGWVAVRREKKQANTLIAFELVKKEAEKAGLSLEQAIKESVERSWAGFRASWLDKETEPEKIITAGAI